MPHLFVAVTAHGYGHLAQVAPAIGELWRRIPGFKITLQADIDPNFARRRLPPGFDQVPESPDPGLVMDGPLAVRWEESLAAYARFEEEYDRRLESQQSLLRRLRPDLVVTDIPWLPLDAAKRIGIPAVGLCSFTWYDILKESTHAESVPAPVCERMRLAYRGADLFIRPAPGMPMDWLPAKVDVGPIARRQPDRSREIRERLGIRAGTPLALMQFGGFEGLDPLRDWPEQDRVHWLVPELRGPCRRDASGLRAAGLDVLDVLGSVELMVAKPGYGTYAEAACNGIPVLYVSRMGWPEQPYLDDWIARRVPALEVPLSELLAGRIDGHLARLLAQGRAAPTEPTGISESADLLAPYLI